MRRENFSQRRRSQLAFRPVAIEALEFRNLITDPLNVTAMALGLPLALRGMASVQSGGLAPARHDAPAKQSAAKSKPGDAPLLEGVRDVVLPIFAVAKTGGGRLNDGPAGSLDSRAAAANTGDWLNLQVLDADATDEDQGSPSLDRRSAAARTGGGDASAPRAAAPAGGRGGIRPFNVPAPTTTTGGGAAASALLTAAGSSLSPSSGPNASAAYQTPAVTQNVAAGPSLGAGVRAPGFSGGAYPSSIPDLVQTNSSPAAQNLFTYFPVYVVDYNDGQVLMPGADQLASPSGFVDLRAQVRDTTVSSYSWDTTGLTDAVGISGSSSYDLTFNWAQDVYYPAVDSVTLSVTDANSHTETFTYSFQVPVGSGPTISGGGTTWPGSLPPDWELSRAPAFDSHNVSVDATSGSLDATLDLPGYNPNVAPLALTYDSLTADPRPIIVAPHTIDAAQAVPSKVSGQLTFNGSTGTAWYYDTSQFNPGDIQQIALQADATALPTGRYGYSDSVVDYRTSNTTTTVTGTATIVNQSNNAGAGSDAFGSGWTLQGLEKITSATGGVVLDLGDGGRSLWFTGSFVSGGTYTNPAGEFSTLVEGAGGTYTRTLTDGTQITFDSSGRETATIDTNNLRVTYAYNGSSQLSTITDPYGKITTFTYSGDFLQTIEDPANRLTTLTHSGGSSGGNLTGATLPDGSTWSYGYDAAGRMTSSTDPNSKIVTVAYDAANRASTVTRPDGSHESFVADQERGWTDSGTSGSPAAATLLAEARSTYTDPNGNVTDLRPDWNGQGLTNVAVDPLGNVAVHDRDSNGLATIAVDRLNRITQYGYDAEGNVGTVTYADLNTDKYTYNSFSEVVKHTDANGKTTTYTYDAHGNLTNVQDPLNNRTTMTYTGDGMLATSKDANNHTTSYQYDSQDRLTTVTNADSSQVVYGYDGQGDVTSTTDERGDTTTFSYDALDRRTGSTDALTNRTTITYDSAGNRTVVQLPTPAGQTARTTTYAYDSMNRTTTITAPLSRISVYGYDSGGNRTTVEDALGRSTTTVYDALNRPTVVEAPLTAASNAVTTTTYDAEGQVVQVVDPMSRITTTTYNNRGWAATVTDPLGNTSTYAYTATGKAANVTIPNSGGTLYSYTYDDDDRLSSTTDALGDTTTYGYDGVGNRTSVEDPNGDTTTYLYDSRDRLTTVTDALGHSTVYGYDSGGNQTTVKDALGDATTTVYDALNRATTVTDPNGGVTTMAYDAAGRETGLTDPSGNRTTWAYDSADRMTTMTDPLSHSATYVYNADDQLTDATDRDGRRTTYSYDSGGRQTGETWVGASPSEVVSYTYDADNELTGAVDGFATLTFTYDSGGNQLTAATSGPGTGQPSVTLTAGYDASHDRTSLTDDLASIGRTTFTYDPAMRPSTVAASYGGVSGPSVAYTYDSGGRTTSVSRTVPGSGVWVGTSNFYDAADRLVTITHAKYTGDSSGGSGGTTTPLATYVYSYDDADRTKSEKNAEGTVTYTYDSGGQLTGASGSRTESYTYDSGGNRTMTGYTTGGNNELTASPGATYTYDAEGNLISQTDTATHVVTSYTYDYRNRLTGVETGGTMIATYTYDALDRRIGFKDSGVQTWTVYDGESALGDAYADFNGSGTLQMRYLFGPAVDAVLARTSSVGATAWYLADKLGSVRDVANASGAVIDHVVYDSFGQTTSETNPANDRFKFTGRELDYTTGSYYYRSRYYDSTIGRFAIQDLAGFAGGDYNLYRYVNNGPASKVDPSGQFMSDGTTGNFSSIDTTTGRGSGGGPQQPPDEFPGDPVPDTKLPTFPHDPNYPDETLKPPPNRTTDPPKNSPPTYPRPTGPIRIPPGYRPIVSRPGMWRPPVGAPSRTPVRIAKTYIDSGRNKPLKWHPGIPPLFPDIDFPEESVWAKDSTNPARRPQPPTGNPARRPR